MVRHPGPRRFQHRSWSSLGPLYERFHYNDRFPLDEVEKSVLDAAPLGAKLLQIVLEMAGVACG